MRRPILLWLCALALAAPACASPQPALETLDPSPGAALRDGERFEYSVTEPGHEPARGQLQAVRTTDGWSLQQYYESAINPEHVDRAEVTVNQALRPQSSLRAIGLSEGAERHALTYRPAEARVDSTRTREGKTETRELRLRDGAYDNDSAFWLWRSLPLTDGYTARYTSVNSYERSQSTVVLTVVGRAEVTVPAGVIDAWRLLVVNGRASRTAWIEVAPPHRLVQWDNGAAVMLLTGER